MKLIDFLTRYGKVWINPNKVKAVWVNEHDVTIVLSTKTYYQVLDLTEEEVIKRLQGD